MLTEPLPYFLSIYLYCNMASCLQPVIGSDCWSPLSIIGTLISKVCQLLIRNVVNEVQPNDNKTNLTEIETTVEFGEAFVCLIAASHGF